MLRFVTGEPALVAGGSLVIGDLHLGLEHELAAAGIRIPEQTGRTLRRIRRLLEETGCRELVVLGDLKHTVTGAPETPEVVRFINELERSVKVTLVQGNHDGTLRDHFPGMVPGSGFRRRDCYFLHGHAAPDKAAFRCRHIIMSHLHPALEFRDSLGGRMTERVWMRGPVKGGAELVVVPAFNDLLGGIDVRVGMMGPMRKFVDEGRLELFLLDGTPLGRLRDL